MGKGKKKRSKSKAKKPQAGAGRKVGIVCHSIKDNENKDGYYEIKIYVVDIDRESRRPGGKVEEYALPTPAVRFIFPITTEIPGICVLKSTVYIFAGNNLRAKHPFQTHKKYCKKFVLSDEVLKKGNYRVEGAQLAEISDMHYAKGSPIAIPTPDGENILVFGVHSSVKDSSHAFEIYRPRWNSWEKLPGLPWECVHMHVAHHPCSCSYDVLSYGFVGKSQSHFFVETKNESFALDLAAKKWSTVIVPPIPGRGGYFLTAKDQYVLTPTRAYNLYDGKGFLLEDGIATESHFVHGPPFELSTFVPPNTPDWMQQFDRPSIIPLRPFLVDGGQVCNTCILQIETADFDLVARVLIDVCGTDLMTLKTTVSKCVSLRIDFLDYLLAVILVTV